MYEQAPEILEALSVAKELNAERFVLNDKMNKLSNEIVELNSKKGTKINHCYLLTTITIITKLILSRAK